MKTTLKFKDSISQMIYDTDLELEKAASAFHDLPDSSSELELSRAVAKHARLLGRLSALEEIRSIS